MSLRTRSRRVASRKRALKALLGALGIAVACITIAASGVPFEADAKGGGLGQPGGDEDIKAMNKAFSRYLKVVKETQKLFIGADSFSLDDAHAVGAYDLIVAFMHGSGRNAMTSSGSGRRGYPRFAGFDDPDTRIGVDNPDTQYMGTIVDNSSGDQIWKVFGNRSNSTDFIITSFDASVGEGGGATVEDEAMLIAPDGSYEVIASNEYNPAYGPKSNWLKLTTGKQIQIARRHSQCDWSKEVPGEVHIERMGTDGVQSGPLDPAVMTQQMEDAISLFEVQAPFWPAFIDTLNVLPANFATPWQPTAGLGITTQLSMLMRYDLADDEALIIRLPDDEPWPSEPLGFIAGYYGLQLSNFWGSSADWANRHVSMSWGLDGECQGEMSQPTFHPGQQVILDRGGEFCGQQDAYFIVLSAQDPGVRNWVDTAEMSQGIIAARLQSVPADNRDEIVGFNCMLPVAIKVPVAAVKAVLGAPPPNGLGASFTNYGATERENQLKVRQKFARDKYIFW